jgi:hypothetical protein
MLGIQNSYLTERTSFVKIGKSLLQRWCDPGFHFGHFVIFNLLFLIYINRLRKKLKKAIVFAMEAFCSRSANNLLWLFLIFIKPLSRLSGRRYLGFVRYSLCGELLLLVIGSLLSVITFLWLTIYTPRHPNSKVYKLVIKDILKTY